VAIGGHRKVVTVLSTLSGYGKATSFRSIRGAVPTPTAGTRKALRPSSSSAAARDPSPGGKSLAWASVLSPDPHEPRLPPSCRASGLGSARTGSGHPSGCVRVWSNPMPRYRAHGLGEKGRENAAPGGHTRPVATRSPRTAAVTTCRQSGQERDFMLFVPSGSVRGGTVGCPVAAFRPCFLSGSK